MSTSVNPSPGIKLDTVDDTFSEILLREAPLISACAFTPRNIAIIVMIKILFILIIFLYKKKS